MPTTVLKILAAADTGAAQAQLGLLDKRIKSVAQSSGGATAKMGAAWGTFGLAAGLAVAAFGAKAIKAASDLGESINKTRVIFGAASGSVLKFADDAKSIGIAKAEALDAAAGFGAMAQSAGMSAAASAAMSIKLVKVSADMASFNNQDPSEMLERMRSGLAGEAEPLRRFGVFISEARVKSEAYRAGIAKVGATLTDAQKVQARYNVILQDTKKQQGDFARTVGDSLPNQMRVLRASVVDLSAELGKNLLPVVLEVTKSLTSFVEALEPVLKLVGLAGKFTTDVALGPLKDFGQAINAISNKDLPELGKQFIDSFIPFDIFKQKTEDTAKVTPEMTAAWADAGREFARMSSGLTEIVPEYDAVSARTRTLASGQRLLAEAHKAAAAEARSQLLAENTLAGGLLGIQSASLSAKDAARELVAARKEVNELTKKGKQGSDEYREAVGRLRGAEVRAIESQLGLSSVVNEYIDSLVAAGGSQSDVIAKVRSFARQAGLTKGETNKLVETVKDLVDKYKAVPPKVDTKVQVVGANEVIDQINRVRRAMFLLGGSTATVFVRSKGGLVEAQHGFEGTVTRPTLFLVGEGPVSREHVKITPQGGSGVSGDSRAVHLHFHAPVYGIPDFKRQVEQAAVEALAPLAGAR